MTLAQPGESMASLIINPCMVNIRWPTLHKDVVSCLGCGSFDDALEQAVVNSRILREGHGDIYGTFGEVTVKRYGHASPDTEVVVAMARVY